MADRPHIICRLEDIPENDGRGYIVWPPAAARRSDIFLVRRGSLVRAYHNCCPHKGLSLDWAADRFMDPSGEYIQCANHDALFRLEDGYCVRWHAPAQRSRARERTR